MASTSARKENQRTGRGPTSAFLLAQVGAHAARRFGALVAELDLNPPQAGLLRAIALSPGASQQALAHQLGTPPTRMVALVDRLEQLNLIERKRNPDDRRLYAVHLTEGGRNLLGELRRIAATHDNALLAALDQSERDHLHALLTRVATEQNLTPGVHPGYRNL